MHVVNVIFWRLLILILIIIILSAARPWLHLSLPDGGDAFEDLVTVLERAESQHFVLLVALIVERNYDS